MTEVKGDIWNIILKIVIAVIVPITLAIVGIYGQAIVAEYSANEQKLERIVRRAEAETAFRREMFAALFTNYVDQIAETDDPARLDALTTRLELLAVNFSDFLHLRPLFQQLQRKIVDIFDPDTLTTSGEFQPSPSFPYLKRLEKAANAVVRQQVQAMTMTLQGTSYYVSIPIETIEDPEAKYDWSEGVIGLDGVTYSFELTASNFDRNQRRVDIDFSATNIDNKKSNGSLHEINFSFRLGDFSFPLEKSSSFPNYHQLALSIAGISNNTLVIAVLLFRG